MASHGYLPALKQYLGKVIESGDTPAVLEIGVDRGCMLIPIVVFLMLYSKQFLCMGIDILIQDTLKIMMSNIDHGGGCVLMQNNSLELLPKVVELGMKFNVVLIDGDHNYYTVKHELEYVDKILKPGGVVIIDDYSGRWSERDLWYAERAGYEAVDGATKKVDTDKHGVKPAVDEFLEANAQWMSAQPISGEPIVLTRKES